MAIQQATTFFLCLIVLVLAVIALRERKLRKQMALSVQSETKEGDEMRQNPVDKIRNDAIKKAKAGLGIASCPYKTSSPYQVVWMKAFCNEAQMDWVGGKQPQNGHV